MRNPASTGPRSPLSLRTFPAMVALMLVLSLGWLVVPAPAAAQDDEEPFAEAGVSGNTYESPAFGYSLEWDDEIWQVEEAETSDDNDFLYLTSDASDLYFESYERFDGDAVECRDNAVSSIEDDDRVTEFELLDEDDDDASAFATFSYVVTIDDEALPMTQSSECRVLVEGESVLQIDHLAPQDDFETESDLVADVLDTVVIPGAEAGDTEVAEDEEADSTPVAGDTDDAEGEEEVEPAEATEETDDSEDEAIEDEADATAAATEDEDEEAESTEDATDEDAADDEQEPTPTAAEDEDEDAADDEDAVATGETEAPEDDAEVDATEEADSSAEEDQDEPADEVDPDDLEGVDDDTYTSPSFGYSLEWDADEWTATAATSEDDVDTLVLENDVTVLTLVGTEEFGENLDRCVRTARQTIEDQDGIADVTPVEDAEGNPIEIDEDLRAGAVYTIVSEDEDAPEQVAQIECRVAVEGEAVIQITQITPASDFNDQIDPVSEILDSIAVEGDDEEEETPTPEDDAEPTPDGEEDEEAESAVDGNTYVSPNFGYSLEWDEDVWTFDDSAGDSENSEPGFDTLFLESDNSGLAVIGAEFPDAETCVTEFAAFLRTEGDVDNWAPFEDEDGEQIEGERDGGYFAAFTLTVSQQGQEFELIYYFECRPVVEGESVVLFFMTTSPAAYEDATEELDDLLESLTIPGESGDDEDAEPTPSDEDEEDAEPTPAAEEDQAEPTPDEDEEEDSDSTASNADLDTYTDPDFPFTVTWDEDVWSVADQRTVSDGHNLLNLSANGSDLTIEGWARWDGEPTDCLNDITLNLRAIDGVENFERVSDSDLYPENESTDGAYALYSFTLAPEGRTPVDYYGYVECRTVVEGEAVVVLTLLVPADEYEAIRPDFEPILASIEIDE